MGSFVGQMVDNIKGCGKMVNSMGQVYILIKMVNKNKVYGKMAKL